MVATLYSVSSNAEQLHSYLVKNLQEVYDYLTHEKHSVLSIQRSDIDRYIQLNIGVIRNLDSTDNINLTFLTLLLDVSERFELRGSFQLLYYILQGKGFDFGRRLQAAALYLLNINTVEDLLNRFDSITNLLQEAFEVEEDTEARVLTTIINYYGQIVFNFPFLPEAAVELQGKIVSKRSSDPHSFLQHPLIETILAIDIYQHEQAFNLIHKYLDSYLGRDIIRLFSNDLLLMEDKTQYSVLLSSVPSRFESVREINSKLYLPIKDDTIFHSLQRGVKILQDENQLFAYMYSYGKMHHSKLISAFKILPLEFFQKTIRVIDWGCGQGMAIMTYFDYLSQEGILQDIRHITLVEPSEIALKRASLHSNKFTGGNNFITLNKDLDSIVESDLQNNSIATKLHLFSNIIDIDLFSLSALMNKIKNCFSGENYFVCVSPYVNDVKTSRIDSFVRNFAGFDEYQLFGSLDNKSGTWLNTWSRVVRVFKARF